MKKTINYIGLYLLCVGMMFASNGTFSAGYTSKVIDYGQVTADSTYVVGADIRWEAIYVRVDTFNNIDFSPFEASFDRLDVTGAYGFDSILADVDVGVVYQYTRNSDVLDTSSHWQPFVKVGKNFYTIKAQYDVNSELINFEGSLQNTVQYKMIGFRPRVFVGYTDAKDALPKALNDIKYNAAYYGGSLGVNWKWFEVAGFILRDARINDTVTGWSASTIFKY